MKLLLVGNPGAEHIGAHLRQAARGLDLQVEFSDSTKAFEAFCWKAKFDWWFRGRYPSRLREFSQELLRICVEFKPKWMLSTGISPVETSALQEIGRWGVKRINYLTDDPWNPAHWAPWFMKALPFYDHVFSPRRANLEQLQDLGCHPVSHMPFAYAPGQHFPEPPATPEEGAQFEADIVFAGGADLDRIRMIAPLIKAGFKIHLYGGYWDRYPLTKRCARGMADPRTLRLAIGCAKVALCLVRRSNRDDNSMRSFEVPAMGGCMLVEDTVTHREIFGEDGNAATYFKTAEEMITKLRWLLDHDTERERFAQACYRIVTQGRHTYQDRLGSMLGLP